MAKMKQPNQNDVLRLGQEMATIKANIPTKRWKSLVKMAHQRGYTVRGAVSDRPDALKERTTASLQQEAQRTISTAYQPAEAMLSTRQLALQNLEAKRTRDDAAYRQWMSGEMAQLDAQAAAADQALASQQQAIASETENAAKAARADSLARMQGGVSDPNQYSGFATLDAADQRSRERIATARQQSADVMKIGGDSRTLARASMVAAEGARNAAVTADTTKAMTELGTERSKLSSEKSSAIADLFKNLQERNISVVQSNREAEMAGASLGLKEKDLATQVAAANRKYKLEKAKFDLDAWKAKNADIVDRAKVQLGYDRIKAQDGQREADRALKAWVERYRASKKAKAQEKAQEKTGGVDKEERRLYRDVQTALGLIRRWHKNKRVAPGDQRQELRNMGVDDTTIDVATDIFVHNGAISPGGRAAARKLGIQHTGYFWPTTPTLSTSRPGNAPAGPRTSEQRPT